MIEVSGLVKRYGNFKAVNELSFTVEEGKICGFLGPNGAGKSTTMNMITGYISATAGIVRVNGYDLFLKPEEAKRQIGYLPEIPPLYPDMNPEEYLLFAGELKGIGRCGLRAETGRVMELTGIGSMRRRLIKNLSKGYRQRVGLACALLGDPPVVILDEPTVGLDPKQMIEMRKLVKSLGGGHTVILSSHILSEVSAVCDHILILSKGKLVAGGTPSYLGSCMKPSNVYELLVQGETEVVRKALDDLDGVKNIEVSMGGSGFAAVRLETEGENDLRTQMFWRLAQAGCPIMELTADTLSLEDVFLELTQDSGAEERKEIDAGSI